MAEETEVVFLSAEDVARMLTDAANGLTTSEYTQMLEEVLDNVESDVGRASRSTCPRRKGFWLGANRRFSKMVELSQ